MDWAAADYRAAIELTDNAAEIVLLQKRLAALTRPAP
jgi:predicted RNA polymerase sigma factor